MKSHISLGFCAIVSQGRQFLAELPRAGALCCGTTGCPVTDPNNTCADPSTHTFAPGGGLGAQPQRGGEANRQGAVGSGSGFTESPIFLQTLAHTCIVVMVDNLS